MRGGDLERGALFGSTHSEKKQTRVVAVGTLSRRGSRAVHRPPQIRWSRCTPSRHRHQHTSHHATKATLHKHGGTGRVTNKEHDREGFSHDSGSPRSSGLMLWPLNVDSLVDELLPQVWRHHGCAGEVVACCLTGTSGQEGEGRIVRARQTKDHLHRIAAVAKRRHVPIGEARVAAGE